MSKPRKSAIETQFPPLEAGLSSITLFKRNQDEEVDLCKARANISVILCYNIIARNLRFFL